MGAIPGSYRLPFLFLAFLIFRALPTLAAPPFEAEIVNLLNPPHNTHIFLNFGTSLFHIDSTGNASADLQIELSIRDKNSNRIIQERNFREAIVQQFHQQENTPFKDYPFSLTPGEYKIGIEVKDRFTGKYYFMERSFSCRDLNKEIGLSDLRFTVIREFGGITLTQALLGSSITSLPDQIRFDIEVYAPRNTLLAARAVLYKRQDDLAGGSHDRDRLKAEQFTSLNERVLTLKSYKTQQVISEVFSLQDLSRGEYKIEVYLYKADSLISETGRNFSIEWKYLGEIYGDLDRSIRMMSHIANDEIIERLLETESEELKLERFQAFWDRKSESHPDGRINAMEHYYNRVFSANEALGAETAWNTDRGRIWCTYGVPDDRRTEKDLEIWTYKNWNLHFVFLNGKLTKD